MSNTVYNAKQYVTFSANEFISLMVTAFFASFALTFNSWGDTTFDAAVGVQALVMMFMAVLVILIITVWICKIVAIRYGYKIYYKAHYFGLFIGIYVTILSKGYFPLFFPGGFSLEQPERLRLGKFHGFYKGWEIGVIAATFPLAILVWIVLFSPLYLATGAQFYLQLIIAVCLFAVYACIPIPFIETGTKGRAFDIFKYFRGATFGLEVFLASGAWYVIMTITVLLFAALSYLLTVLSVQVGIILYILMLILVSVCWLIYTQFFKH
jgi:hypothetical protein